MLTKFECNECGQLFSKNINQNSDFSLIQCPKCSSYDIEPRNYDVPRF